MIYFEIMGKYSVNHFARGEGTRMVAQGWWWYAAVRMQDFTEVLLYC